MSAAVVEPFAELRDHASTVNCVSFSPDSRTLVSAGSDSTVRVWDVASATQQGCFTGHTAYVFCARFAPDGTRCASGDLRSLVLVWDVQRLATLKELSGHAAWVLALAWSDDGVRLASASADKTVRVWDVERGTAIFVLNGHTDRVWYVDVSVDGQMLVSGSGNMNVRVWDMRDGTQIAAMEPGEYIRMVAFGGDSKTVITATEDNAVLYWDVTTAKKLRTFKTKNNKKLNAAALSPDQSCMISGENILACSVRVTHVQSGEDIAVLAQDKLPIQSVAWSPDGRWIAAGGHDEVVWLWKTSDAVRKLFVPAAQTRESLLGVAAVESAIRASQNVVTPSGWTWLQLRAAAFVDAPKDVAVARSTVKQLSQSLNVELDKRSLHLQISAAFRTAAPVLDQLHTRCAVFRKAANAHLYAVDATLDSLSRWNARARAGVIQLDAVIEANARQMTETPEPLRSLDATSRIGQLREAIDELTATISDYGAIYA